MRRLTRMSASSKTLNLIPAKIMDDWATEHADNELREFEKQIDRNNLDPSYATSGLFAVDDLEHPTRYFAVDVQQFRSTGRVKQWRSEVAIVEVDQNGQATGDVDVHVEYSNARSVMLSKNIVFTDGTVLKFVQTPNVQALLNGDFEPIR